MHRFILLLMLGMMLLLGGCTTPNAATSTLQKHGFTDISTRGYDMFACSDSDVSATKFTATNSAGMRVNGVVCCGILKRCTVRF
jgi:hypothetical protein